MLLSDVYSGPCVLNTKVVNVGVVGGGPVLWKSPGEKAVLYNIMTHGFTVYGESAVFSGALEPQWCDL